MKKNKDILVKDAAQSVKSLPIYSTVILLWLIYVIVSLITPVTNNQFYISDTMLFFLRLTIAVPYLFIWLFATYSYLKIKRYSIVIQPSSESRAFAKISRGILLLLCGLLLSAHLSTFRTSMVNNVDVLPLLTIIINYSYIVPYLIAFIFMFNGIVDLNRKNFSLDFSKVKGLIFGIPFVVLSYIWLEIIFTNQNRVNPAIDNPFATYYLPDSLLVLTIVIPSLATWTIGFFSIVLLRKYYRNVKGVLYKRALFSLRVGITGVIIASVLLQALLSLGTERLVHLGLGNLLIVIYIFLITQALGFYMMARGAGNLTKIESV